MRKVMVSCLLVLLLSSLSWSTSQPEVKDLRVLGAVDQAVLDYALPALAAKGVTAKWLKLDLSDGSTMTMDAMVAAGTPPDVYTDYMGRVSKYVTEAYALDLKPYIKTDDFRPGVLDPLTRNGKLLALPMPGGAQGMVINLKLLEKIGEKDFNFDNWKISDFMRMATKAKAAGVWATGLFAANQSGDYLWYGWAASFGAELYKPGDYSKTAMNTPAGLAFFTFLRDMVRDGYAPKEAAVLTDDDYVLQWASGKILATAFFPAWVKPYFADVQKQGMGGGDFAYKFVEFPRAPGVTRVPTAGSYGGIVVAKATKAPKAAALAAETFSDARAQTLLMREGSTGRGFPNRKSVIPVFDDVHWKAIEQIVSENGLLDLGISTPKFSEVRSLAIPILQQLYTNKIEPAAALAAYCAVVDKVLSRP